MTSRGKGVRSNDWDPMRDEYENSSFDMQSNDDSSGAGQRNERRLYVTNIPKALNVEGLRAAFSKYGNLTEVFLSRDPGKRYGLVTFETTGEARNAMMQLRNTEPLRLSINIAYNRKKPTESNNYRQDNSVTDRSSYKERSNYDDTTSIGSRGRNIRRPDMNNSIEMDEEPLDDDGLTDPELHMELVQLKLEELKLQQEKLHCKQQMLLLNRAGKRSNQSSSTNRCILPDGRIVVSVNDRSSETRDTENNFGAGDSSKIPALQRVGSRACIACGARADCYCARCGVAPYCSVRCQRKDWAERHSSVCHNLARVSSEPVVNDVVEDDARSTKHIPAPAPLRRPHSPKRQNRTQESRSDDSPRFEAPPKKFVPPGHPPSNIRSEDRNGGDVEKRRSNQYNKPVDGRRPYKQDGLEDRGAKKTEMPPVQKPMQNNRQDMNNRNNINTNDTKAEPPVPKSAPKKEMETPQEPVQPKQEIAEKKEVSSPKSNSVLKSVNDVTPVKKIVPKNYVIELLEIGDSVLLSVDNTASECKSQSKGFVCLSMHENYEDGYTKLCDDYAADCEADPGMYTPSPGESFSYFNPEDGGWYRARSVNLTQAALIDSGKLVTLDAASKCKKLSAAFAAIPEFCCILDATGVQVGESLKCTLKSKNTNGFVADLENVETGAVVGKGDISRWLPTIEYPVAVTPAPAPQIPSVARPSVSNSSKVLLVDVTAIDRAFVRPSEMASQLRFDTILQDIVLYGRTASPLSTPPRQGETVVGEFSDGLHYRAICRRTNVKQNKYQLEYVEFGNIDVTTLDKLYPCPPEMDLNSQPTEVSMVRLQTKNSCVLNETAMDYLNTLKDDPVELILSLPNGAKSGESGAEVVLALEKNGEVVNRRIEEMCTPEWKKLEEKGCDVIETPVLMYQDLKYVELPPDGCEIELLDLTNLPHGSVSGHEKGLINAEYLMQVMPKTLEAYCNSDIGREPYLPAEEELCVVQCPDGSWARGVVCDRVGGAGGSAVSVCLLEQGSFLHVGHAALRKMLREFVVGAPVATLHLDIAGFPPAPTPEMLERARQHLKVGNGRGVLKVTKCQQQEPGLYTVEAPDLIRAMLAN